MSFRSEDTLEQIVDALSMRVDNHLTEYDLHRAEILAQLNTQTQTLTQNTVAITALTEALSELTAATTGVVEAYTTANNVQRFVKWLAAFGLLAAVSAWLVKAVTHHLGS